MGAVARKIHEPLSEARTTPSEEAALAGAKLPQRSQVMDLAALAVAGPGSVALSIATCVLGIWGGNTGDPQAWWILLGLWVVYAGAASFLFAAAFAER